MKPSPVSTLIIFPLLALVIVQLACSFGAPPANSPQSPNAAPQQPAGNTAPVTTAQAPASSGNANAGQVVISGAVNKTYTPINFEAGTLGNSMIINLHETTIDGISLAIPPDTQPGTYAIEDHLTNAVVDFSGEYALWKSDAFYESTKGTLTLTATGSKFSGQFQFTAVNSKDSSKTIEVTGSFADVPVK
jgi:hypothetical protein